MLGTGRLYAPSLQGRRALLLPAGALVYIAVPPARDFATSGLENGLVLAYLGLLWWMLVCWSQALRRPNPVSSKYFDATLAAVAGLSVLIRPELALIGGGALVMMLIAARGWRRRVLIGLGIGGAVILVALLVLNRRLTLQDLFTAPEARGQGVARALIEAVYARADAAGVPLPGEIEGLLQREIAAGGGQTGAASDAQLCRQAQPGPPGHHRQQDQHQPGARRDRLSRRRGLARSPLRRARRRGRCGG